MSCYSAGLGLFLFYLQPNLTFIVCYKNKNKFSYSFLTQFLPFCFLFFLSIFSFHAEKISEAYILLKKYRVALAAAENAITVLIFQQFAMQNRHVQTVRSFSTSPCKLLKPGLQGTPKTHRG